MAEAKFQLVVDFRSLSVPSVLAAQLSSIVKSALQIPQLLGSCKCVCIRQPHCNFIVSTVLPECVNTFHRKVCCK